MNRSVVTGPVSFYEAFLQPGVENYILILVSAVACWFIADYVSSFLSGLYFPQYNSLSDRQKNEWNGRVVAGVHALFAVTLCPGYFWPPTSLTYFDNVTGTTRIDHYGFDAHTQFIYSISTGYFLWDTIVCIQHQWGFEYVLHAILSFFVYYMNLFPFLHYWGRFYLGFFEMSSIPLHCRGCMIMLKYNKIPEKKHLFMLAQNIWVVIYTINRIFIGTYTTYIFLIELHDLWLSGKYHAGVLIVFSAVVVVMMMFLMYYWFYQIVMGLLSRGRQNDRRDNEDEDNDKRDKKD